jgi:predicted permease
MAAITILPGSTWTCSPGTSKPLPGWSVQALMTTLLPDLRFTLRALRRNPLFTAVVMLMLALGMGANTAIFSVMNAIVLRDLPVPNPQQLVFLHTTTRPAGSGQSGHGDLEFPVHIFETLRRERGAFSDLVASVPLAFNKTPVRYGTEPEEAHADMVSGNFFTGLGVGTICGRPLTMEDEKNHSQVAVLGHSYWNGRFGANCFVLGQTLHIRGVPFTIVGVGARDFIGVERNRSTDIWIPLQDRIDLNAWGMRTGKSLYGMRDWWCLHILGRLAPGATEREAQAKLNPVFQRAAYSYVSNPKHGERPPNLFFTPVRGIAGLREQYEAPLRMLLAMVGLVLLIACGNVAMLLSARNAARQREFSIRMAVGGGRADLFRQLLTESLLLVGCGAALGWLFAIGATRSLSAWSELNLSLAPDRTVLLFSMAVSLVIALIFGLAPLRSAVRAPAGLSLKTASSAGSDAHRALGRKLVIAAQVALCSMLLIGAGLLVRSLRNLEHVQLGMRTSGLLVFGISPQLIRSQADVISFHRALLERLRGLPGVSAATVMQNRIGSGWSNNTNAFVDGKNPQVDNFSPLRWNAVGDDYFRTLGTAMVAGRDFNASDSASAPKVAIVNQTFVKRYLPSENALGHQVGWASPKDFPQYTIIGVVADSKYTGVREPDTPTAYFPYQQIPEIGAMNYELRTAGDPAAFLPVVQRAIREFAPDVPLSQPRTQQQQFNASFSQERLIARLSMFFGLLAVVLVATGVYGALAYAVSRRTSEVGLRMALGAKREQILWMILRESLVVCLAGIALGLPLAFACSRLLQSMLFGVKPGDPLTFAAALAGITVVALFAGFLPAVRAASINPIVALRYE